MHDSQLVGRWWNRTYGSLARRDVYLRRNIIWEVEARQGGADGVSRTWNFDTEGEARQFVTEHCLTGPRQWKDLSRLVADRTEREDVTPAAGGPPGPDVPDGG